MCSVYPPTLLPCLVTCSVCPTCSTRRVEPTSRFSAHAVAQPVRSRPSPCSTSLSHTIPSMIPRVSLSAATTARGRQRLELAVLTLFISKRRMFQKRSVASDVTEVKAVIAVAQCRSRFWLSTFGATTCSICLHDSFSDDSFLSTPPSGQVSSVSLLERPTAYIARLGSTRASRSRTHTRAPLQVCSRVTRCPGTWHRPAIIPASTLTQHWRFLTLVHPLVRNGGYFGGVS